MRSTITGRSKGYGYIDYRHKADAITAKLKLSSAPFHGRTIRIDWADSTTLEAMHSCVLFVDKLPYNFNVRIDLIQHLI